MATRSTLRIKIKGNNHRGIYVHFVNYGYPSYMLDILKEHYDTEEKVNELLELGDCSAIYEMVKPPEGVTHNFDNQYPDVTVAYHRDRGEELRFSGDRGDQEYNYVFTEKGWKIHDGLFNYTN